MSRREHAHPALVSTNYSLNPVPTAAPTTSATAPLTALEIWAYAFLRQAAKSPEARGFQTAITNALATTADLPGDG